MLDQHLRDKYLRDEKVSELVTLWVGRRSFLVACSTLRGTGYLDSFKRITVEYTMNTGKKLKCDRHYFLDADHVVFKYVLNYLRSGGSLPILWRRGVGFDYELYHAIRIHALQFGVNDLARAIENCDFEKAIEHRYAVELRKGALGHKGVERTNVDEKRTYFNMSSLKKKYECPTGLHFNVSRCGEACRKRQPEKQENRHVWVDEVKYLVIKKWTVFRPTALSLQRGGRLGDRGRMH